VPYVVAIVGEYFRSSAVLAETGGTVVQAVPGPSFDPRSSSSPAPLNTHKLLAELAKRSNVGTVNDLYGSAEYKVIAASGVLPLHDLAQGKTEMVIALEDTVVMGGGFLDSGVGILASTDASVVAIRDNRVIHRAGDWGILGQAGGAFHLASLAISAIEEAHDGRGPKCDATTNRVLDWLKVSSPTDLEAGLRAKDKRTWAQWKVQLSHLLPAIADAAVRDGDEIAHQVFQHGARALARACFAATKQDSCNSPCVVMCGDVFDTYPKYEGLVREEIRQLLPDAEVLRARHRPLVGALVYALGQGRRKPTPEVMATLQGCLEDCEFRDEKGDDLLNNICSATKPHTPGAGGKARRLLCPPTSRQC
jgi:N-acetylglucosamine kinase-like BadF-type ATPase